MALGHPIWLNIKLWFLITAITIIKADIENTQHLATNQIQVFNSAAVETQRIWNLIGRKMLIIQRLLLLFWVLLNFIRQTLYSQDKTEPLLLKQ